MRKLIATVFNYSLDGLLADEGTEFGSSASTCPKTVSPTTRRNSTFSRARTHTSWAAPPTRASPGP